MAYSDLPPLDFAIRRCRYGDWPTLRRLIEECFPHLTLADIQFLLCRHMRGIRTMHHGKVMSGFTIFYPTEEFGVAWLERIGVADSFRGRKLGEVLLEDLLDTLADHGYDRLILAVDFENTSSLTLFDRQDGFRRICEEGRVTFETRVPVQTESRNRVSLFPPALIGQLAYIWRRFLYYCLLRSPKTLREQ